MKYIDSQTDWCSDKKLDDSNCIEAQYDPCTKSGLLSFDNDMVKNESLKKDIYFFAKRIEIQF